MVANWPICILGNGDWANSTRRFTAFRAGNKQEKKGVAEEPQNPPNTFEFVSISGKNTFEFVSISGKNTFEFVQLFL